MKHSSGLQRRKQNSTMPKKKLAKKGFDWKDTEKFDKTASEVGGAIENLQNQLRTLNTEIRADKDGLFDFDNRLRFLYKERDMLENRMKENSVWADKFTLKERVQS